MLRVVADLGNTRLKWGRLDAAGRLAEMIALPLDDPSAWAAAWSAWQPRGRATRGGPSPRVNPPVADRLEAFFEDQGIDRVTWIRSAAEVPVPKDVEGADTEGPTGRWRSSGRRGSSRRAAPAWSCCAGRRSPSSGSRPRASGRGARSRRGWARPRGAAPHDRPAPVHRALPDPAGLGPRDGRLPQGRHLLGHRRRRPRVAGPQEADLGSDPWVVWTGGDAGCWPRRSSATEAASSRT